MPEAAFILSRKAILIHWAAAFSYAAVFDSNGYDDAYGEFDLLIAVAHTPAGYDQEDVFGGLEKRLQNKPWLFGYFGYDLKNQVEELTSKNGGKTGFPESAFFEPEKLIGVKRDGSMILQGMDGPELLRICASADPSHPQPQPIAWQHRTTKDEYLKKVAKIGMHIRRGDIYETNFCQEFYAEDVSLSPAKTFISLTKRSPVPFSAFFRMKDLYAICLSPERFLCRRNPLLVSQPIKGTAPRGDSPETDARLRRMLQENTKERAENIMITDLVRNDMARSAEPGSVTVTELCKVYSYPTVHQMISTITGQVKTGCSAAETIRNMFPMGSMTGAPKISAMKLMDELEDTRRNIYSGALGYFSPDGDFDFNVVIRTLVYNAHTGYLSYHTGSAITHLSNPEEEYEECLLKRKIVDFV